MAADSGNSESRVIPGTREAGEPIGYKLSCGERKEIGTVAGIKVEFATVLHGTPGYR